MTSDPSVQPPVLRVANGRPTPEELAAVVAVLCRRRPAADPPPALPPSRWNDRAALLRPSIDPGLGAWRGAVR